MHGPVQSLWHHARLHKQQMRRSVGCSLSSGWGLAFMAPNLPWAIRLIWSKGRMSDPLTLHHRLLAGHSWGQCPLCTLQGRHPTLT